MKVKDFLGVENDRNKKHAALYTDLIRRAYGKDTAVLIGHHLCFEFGNNIDSENEIPSADTLLFDHEVMFKVFGNEYQHIMRHLCSVPAEQRDLMLAEYITLLDRGALKLPDVPAAA